MLQLASHKIAMNAYATWLFLEVDFVSDEQQLYLQQVTPRSLGFTAPTTYLEFTAAVLAQGYVPCPWCTAIYLRIQWMEQLDQCVGRVATRAVHFNRQDNLIEK